MLQIDQLAKSYGPEPVVRGISMALGEAETLAVLGRSGCGKTTFLRLLAGLEQPDSGEVRLDGRNLAGVPPQGRGILYLSQFPLLFPHLSVFENIAFGLRVRKLPEKEIAQRVAAMLEQVGMGAHARKMPEGLSGGQQQRIAFGRAMVLRPRLLLLDEPFASLDPHTRQQMQELFLHLREAHRTAAIFVTHDLKEALLLGQRIGRMEAGNLRLYPSAEDFARDPESGVAGELGFWARFLP